MCHNLQGVTDFMSHGCVREGWRVISASVPTEMVQMIDDLGKQLGHNTRSDTLRLMLAKYFEDNTQI